MIMIYIVWLWFIMIRRVNTVNIRMVNGYRVEATFVQITFEFFFCNIRQRLSKMQLIFSVQNFVADNKINLINKSNSICNRPWAKDVALVHDSYHCKKYANTTPFPSQRKEGPCNFVACIPELISSTVHFTPKYECPRTCRPMNHQDWKYC